MAEYSDQQSNRDGDLRGAANSFARIPLLEDPRFVYDSKYEGMAVRDRSYAIVTRVDATGEPEILLKQRGDKRSYAGYFDLPGGETSAQGLAQLVYQQLHVTIAKPVPFGPALWQLAADVDDCADRAQGYLASLQDFSPQAQSLANTVGYEWVSRERLKQLDVINLDKDLEPEKSGRMGLLILAALDQAH